METQLVADKLGIKVSTINSRFEWLRKKKTENQTFVNQLNNFEKTCPYIKKRLTSLERKRSKPEEQEDENE